MWIVFYGDDSHFIDRLGDVYISKDKAIEQAAWHAITHQHFSCKRHKTFDQFKNELAEQLEASKYASIDYADTDFIVYDHVGVYKVYQGD